MNIGIIFGILALVTFAFADTLFKRIAKFDWYSLAVSRIAVTVVVLGAIIFSMGKPLFAPLSWAMVLVSIIGLVAYIFLIMAMRYSKASIVTSVVNSYVLVVVVLSWIFRGERLSMFQYLAIGLILIGMYVIHVQRGASLKSDLLWNRGFYFALLTFFLWGLLYFFIVIPIKNIGALNTSFYLEFIMLACLILILPFRKLKIPTGKNLGFLLVYGVVIAFASWFVTLSIREIGSSLANAILAGVPLGVMVIAYFWLKEKLKFRQYLGIASIVIGLVIISLFTV